MSVIQVAEKAQAITIAVCQMYVVAKRPDLNAARIISFIKQAHAEGADTIVFPEMAISGYMVGDDWEDQAFINDCVAYASDIEAVAQELSVFTIFGNVTPGHGTGEDGRPRKFNSVISVVPGIGSSEYHKTNLPNYREFDDKRYFCGGDGSHDVFMHRDAIYSSTICEDGWDDDYNIKPIAQAHSVASRNLYNNRMHVHFNLSCSPFTQGKNGARNRRFAQHSRNFAALIYVNNVGVQNNGKNVFVFDGSSTVYHDGKVVCVLPAMEECLGLITITEHGEIIPQLNPFPYRSTWNLTPVEPKTHEVLTYAIKEFCAQSKIKRVVIGLSGGVDSALSVMLHAAALGSENVIAVNMPTQFNSETTKGIAQKIAWNLNVRYLEIPIGRAVEEFKTSVISGLYSSGVKSDDFWEDDENIQARMRGAGVQAMLAAGFHAVFPNNGNKAEATVGYCTLGGDLMGYLAPIADLWKHEVYRTASELDIALGGGILPPELYTIKPSAELSAAQSVDAGQGDPIVYWYHDKLFASWVEPWSRANIEDTLRLYSKHELLASLGLIDKFKEFRQLFPTTQAFIDDLERWWSLFKGMGIVKRVQSPPIVVISRRAFGFDFRESIGAVHYTRKYLTLRAKLLNVKKENTDA